MVYIEYKDKVFDLAVAGAGPAGIIAAIRAAQLGKDVLVIEKNNIICAKVLISGKGRCNLTNTAQLQDFIENFNTNGRFLYSVFRQFFNQDLINFFELQGLKLVTERGGRIFPESNSSYSVVSVLKKYINDLHIRILFKNKLEEIMVEGGAVKGIKISNGLLIKVKAVLLATGGLSYPKTGSTGDGYKIAKMLGHNIIKPIPGLVGLETKETFCKRWQGISLKNVSATLSCGGKKIVSEFGELLFTHFGVSGPIVLSLSTTVSELISQNKGPLVISINMKSELSRHQIDERLIRLFSEFKKRLLKNILGDLIPTGMIGEFINMLNIEPEKKINQVTKQERLRLINLLTDIRITITKTRPIDEAIITKGGIDTTQINPKTMESKLIKGLYFAGELIDIDAKTGGFNLQAAFSTGYAAGNSC